MTAIQVHILHFFLLFHSMGICLEHNCNNIHYVVRLTIKKINNNMFYNLRLQCIPSP